MKKRTKNKTIKKKTMKNKIIQKSRDKRKAKSQRSETFYTDNIVETHLCWANDEVSHENTEFEIFYGDKIEVHEIFTFPPELDDWGYAVTYYDPETTVYTIEYSEVWDNIKSSKGALKELYTYNYEELETVWDFEQTMDEWYTDTYT